MSFVFFSFPKKKKKLVQLNFNDDYQNLRFTVTYIPSPSFPIVLTMQIYPKMALAKKLHKQKTIVHNCL